MADTIQCDTHGESVRAYVCSHLSPSSIALGFNRSEPEASNPFPDAWCDDCEAVRAAHGGWNDSTDGLIKIALICSGCYEQTRIHNTRTATSLEDLSGFHWKCGSCEEWHTGAILDSSYAAPEYWSENYEEVSSQIHFPFGSLEAPPPTFLNKNYCAIEGKNFFAYGLISLPILGTATHFNWGVWGSLARENFERLLKRDAEKRPAELPPMFSWMSTSIIGYPETINLKLNLRARLINERPKFDLEKSEHPLSLEYHNGITPERVQEIMVNNLGFAPE